MTTHRDIVDEDTERWATYDRVSWPTRQAIGECVAIDAACNLIGDPRSRPYAADPELKALRAEARNALMELSRALYAKTFALIDAERSTR